MKSNSQSSLLIFKLLFMKIENKIGFDNFFNWFSSIKYKLLDILTISDDKSKYLVLFKSESFSMN